jgi:hypothetical protein
MRNFLLLIAAGPLAACTSSSHVTEPGASIYTLDVRKLVVDSEGAGGFLPAPPPDPACSPVSSVYTLTVAGHQLDWKSCEVTFDGTTATYTPDMGSRALADAEWSALQPKLAGLVVSGQRTCGADKPQVSVTVTNSAGEFAYHDDFYSCVGDGSQLYVVSDGLDAALDALGELAGN